jgi:hypothetical protein
MRPLVVTTVVSEEVVSKRLVKVPDGWGGSFDDLDFTYHSNQYVDEWEGDYLTTNLLYKWVATLRGDKYTQCRFKRKESSTRMDAIAVLWTLMDEDGWWISKEAIDSEYHHHVLNGTPLVGLLTLAKLIPYYELHDQFKIACVTDSWMVFISKINDNGYSFNDIADVIEKYLIPSVGT